MTGAETKWWLEFAAAMTCLILSLAVLVAGLWWRDED